VPCECVLEYVEPIEAEALEAKCCALEKRVEELESCICETCHDPACEDSAIEYWRAKAKRFEAVLKEIGNGNALCEGCKGCPLVDAARDAIEERPVHDEHEGEGK
jgi:hypothetical protein